MIIKLSELSKLTELIKAKKEIQAFHICYHKSFGAKFASQKKIIEILEQMILDFYIGLVQHMSNWKRPAPKVAEVKTIKAEWNSSIDDNNINKVRESNLKNNKSNIGIEE